MEFKHTSVLLGESIRELNIRPDGRYVDGTLGGGGHSEAILEKLSDRGELFGFDQDGDAIAAASSRLERFGDRVHIIRSNFSEMSAELAKRGEAGVDGIILDLGVSSFQLDDSSRGFSYRTDAPLDMRMDKEASLTAADVVNSYPQEELTRIIREYGEERFAFGIAGKICEYRKRKRIETTGELSEIIKSAIPAKFRRGPGHPAKQTFQAIRIEVNNELGVLRDSLDGMIDLLNDEGRLCVITFHSLEDRIVKQAFKRNENPCTCPPEFPVCVCGKKSKGTVITKKPITPAAEEIRDNNRSHSAKLRVFERRLERQE